jgi:hypothetical protein
MEDGGWRVEGDGCRMRRDFIFSETNQLTRSLPPTSTREFQHKLFEPLQKCQLLYRHHFSLHIHGI